ncbi:hypothetical protein Nepgr_011567 [Nepenthes gracilis]|uniref:Uncharacterized protein n=1 Tax=Nepenthes gracilis TaxID=150966 RepID=A0AAD3SFC7_NEPGR|nr:hypothetical protein Nepgr_011567 [Nepenthes gracilis]
MWSSDVQPNQPFTEIKIDYLWKPTRCGKSNNVGHSESHSKPVKLYLPTGRFMKDPKPHPSNDRGISIGHVSACRGKVDPGLVKPPLSCKPMGDSRLDNDSFPSSHADGQIIGTQICLESNPDVSCSKTLSALQLESDAIPSQDTNQFIFSDHEGKKSGRLIKAPHKPMLNQPTNLCRDTITLESSNGISSITGILEALESSTSVLQAKSASGNQQFLAGNPMTDSAQVEEIEEDENDFHDPMLNALKVLLEANATQAYLDSLTSEGSQLGGLVAGLHIIDESISSIFSSRRSDRSACDAFSNHAQEEANHVSTPFKQDGHLKQAKSRRHRKSTSKNTKGSLGKGISRNTG